MRVQDQSSENLLGIKPWLSVGVGLGRSLIGLSIGPLALEAHISNTSISLNGIEFVVRGQPEGIQGDYPHASSCTWPSPADSVWSCACTQCSHRTYTAHIFKDLDFIFVVSVGELPVFAGCQSLFSSVVLNALQCLKIFKCDSMRSMIISFFVGREPTLISKSMQGPLCMLMMLAPRSVKKVFR